MKAIDVLCAVLLGIVSMLLTVAASAALGLDHTWFPGGVLAFILALSTTLHLAKRR